MDIMKTDSDQSHLKSEKYSGWLDGDADQKDFDRYICNTCAKTFASLHQLDVHSRLCAIGEEEYLPTGGGDEDVVRLAAEAADLSGEGIEGITLVANEESQLEEEIFVDKMMDEILMAGGAVVEDFDTSDFIEIFACQFCGKTFSQASHLRAHVVWHTGSRLYKCLLCDFSFNRLDHLKRHINTHRGLKPVKELPADETEQTEMFLCPLCSKEFRREDQMRRHILNNHEKEPRFKCNKCGSKFKDENKLKKHVAWHGNYSGRGFKCPFCPSCFRYPSFLMHHMRVHSNERPFPCSSCSKTFKQRSHLKRHMELHLRECAFFCEFCGQSFGSDKLLQSHASSKCVTVRTDNEEEETYYQYHAKRSVKSTFNRNNDRMGLIKDEQQLVPNISSSNQTGLFAVSAATR